MTGLTVFPLVKMSGAGNTFVLIDARKNSLWKKAEEQLFKSRPELAQLFCDRVFGLGVDGVLFIQEGSQGFDFDWDFYNSDGSTAEMCGNAARCAARFCLEQLPGVSLKTDVKFKTGAGLITAKILDDGRVHVVMPEARWVKPDIELTLSTGEKVQFQLVDTGVPHLVKKISNIQQSQDLKEMARGARAHRDLSPRGANVTFYSELTPGQIDAVTFERGVEDYTLACGTGAVAAAMVYARETERNHVMVSMPGGLLEVSFAEDKSHPRMTGTAVFVGQFQYSAEVLK